MSRAPLMRRVRRAPLMRRASLLVALTAGLSLPLIAQDPVRVGPVASERTRTLVLRLRPGQDLRRELLAVVEAQGIEAAAVLTCVGSLTKVTLRYANQPEGAPIEGHHLEIVSLVGTISAHGGSHLHLAVSDEAGRTIGGHLLDGSAVYTTAEVVLQVMDDLRFRRERDPISTYNELVIDRAE